MSGGKVLKSLPKANIETKDPQSIDIFELQLDNMPCKECKKGQKDCKCKEQKENGSPVVDSPYSAEEQ
jgi:hypothetical protein